jgi:hypothetical protein
MTTNLEWVTSADGTQIAVETVGRGRPVVLIGGAFNGRTTTAARLCSSRPEKASLRKRAEAARPR